MALVVIAEVLDDILRPLVGLGEQDLAGELAWPITEPGEADLPEIWPRPLPLVVEYLRKSDSLESAERNLPDVELI